MRSWRPDVAVQAFDFESGRWWTADVDFSSNLHNQGVSSGYVRAKRTAKSKLQRKLIQMRQEITKALKKLEDL